MPYIIKTVSPPPAPNYSHSGNVITRRAVATLDETIRRVEDIAADHGSDIDPSKFVGSEGGTVGPLPDGTMIEVKRVEA